MAEIFTRRKHSTGISALRSRGNAATELRLLALFRARHFNGWRRGASLRRKGEGLEFKAFRVRPDFAFRAHRLAVFVDDCCWPGCPLHATPPSGGKSFPPTAPATAASPAPCAPWAGASSGSGTQRGSAKMITTPEWPRSASAKVIGAGTLRAAPITTRTLPPKRPPPPRPPLPALG